MNELAAKQAVVKACHRAAQEGLVIGTAGNISVRVQDRVFVTATGVVFAEVSEDTVVSVDLDGTSLEGDHAPTSELDLHLGIYRDLGAKAVVHTHAPVSSAASTVLDSLPCIHYQQLLLGGEVRVAPYATFGSLQLADHVRDALVDRQAALMANHGSVAVGSTVRKALDHALLLEWLCTLYRDACAMGTPRALDPDQQTAVVEAAIARSYGTLQPTKRPA